MRLEARPGQIELSVLTGQGRATFAPGDTQATLNVPDLQDSRGNVVTPPNPREIQLLLNGYQNQIFRINADVTRLTEPETGRPLNSRLFTNYALDINRVRRETFDGVFETTDIRNVPSAGYNVTMRLFPGRYTTLPVFINDGMFAEASDPDLGTTFFNFEQAAFNQANGLDITSRITSSLSDYLSFDLRGLPSADRPKLLTGRDAFRVMFTGDNYALASGLGMSGVSGADSAAPGEFNAIKRNDLDPTDETANLIEGRFSIPGSVPIVPGAPSGAGVPGTYSLLQPDPTDPFLTARITSLQGIWREHFRMINNMPEVLAISFPSSRDDEDQDIVVFRQTITRDGTGTVTAAQVTSIYFGDLNLGSGAVRVWPIRNITSGSVAGQATASAVNFLDRNGVSTISPQQTRSGTLTNVTIPGFPSSIPLVVYRH